MSGRSGERAAAGGGGGSGGGGGLSGPIAVLRAGAEPAWLVGGAVRDRLLGRETSDYDVAIADDPQSAARALAREAGGHPFRLSDQFGAWRVVAHDHSWQVDLVPLTGARIEDDLAQRDFTVNAIAEPLGGGELIDPFGGRADLAAARLRMVSPRAFADDPLRALRLARIACELELTIDPETAATARAGASGLSGVAAERVFEELKRIISADGALEGLRLMDALGVSAVVLPEVVALHGVEQSRFHHLDVHDHTMTVLGETIALQRDPSVAFGARAESVAALLAEPLANELTRGQALRFGALFHDIAKPGTRSVTAEGRVTFIGHDAAGAQIAAAVMARLRASERLTDFVAAVTRHHLRLGFLVHEAPLSRRSIYRYLRATDPVQADVTVLSVADRLATRGANAEVAIAKHLALADEMIAEALAWRARPPKPIVRGDEITRELGIAPGPRIGKVLAELQELSFTGEVRTREQALHRARELLGG